MFVYLKILTGLSLGILIKFGYYKSVFLRQNIWRDFNTLTVKRVMKGIPMSGKEPVIEYDDSRAVMKAIAETKYTGYVGHEFMPTREPVEGLSEAVSLCDV